ncbi:MAG: thioesterase family protein [Desulfobulbaceae bacterium]|nr:thioesterase family protein [Desulfobulbaceae bacterium]
MNKLSMSLNQQVHTATIRVLYGDTDAGGIVYNGTYLRFFEFGRGELMRSLDLSYKNLEQLGFLLPVIESYVRYKSPAYYDDLLIIKTCLSEVTRKSCRFHCHIYRDETLIAKGFTKHACIIRSGSLTNLPDDYLSGMQALTE